MTATRRCIAFLRSGTLTIWLVGLFVLYYLTMAVWTGEAFATYVSAVSSSRFFQAFFLLFFLNVLYRVVDALRALRSRPAVMVMRIPLLLGLVLLLFSFFMSLNVRELRWSPPIGEGDTIDLPWEEAPYQIVSVEPALKKKALRTREVFVFDYEPGIMIESRAGERYRIGAFPPRKVGSSFLHVLNFGIGPGIELRKGAEVVWNGYVALRLTPLGVTDSFEIPQQPYRFYLSVLPNQVLKKGRETARDYDLDRPRYRLEVMEGDRVIKRGETETGLSFGGDMSIAFFQPSDWVLIEAVHDPFLLWFVVSLSLLVLGVPGFLASCLIRRKATEGSLAQGP